jgi:hypothetical protein
LLTEPQRTELEALGPDTVRFKLLHSGASRGADVHGFRCGTIQRGDVEDWLSKQAQFEAGQQAATLRWAMIAGWAGIIGVIIAAVGIWLAK